jgi:hypothetical protein
MEILGTELKCKLLSAGFSDVRFLTNDIPENGIIFDQDVSQPLVAAKAPFVMSSSAVSQLVGEWDSARDSVQQARARAANLTQQISMASDSRWLKLGRSLGLGPKFE